MGEGECPQCHADKFHGMHGWSQGMGCCHGGKFRLIRLLVCIAVILIAFWFGVKVGELKAVYGGYESNYGYRIMYPADYQSVNGSAGTSTRSPWIMGPGMMYGWYENYQQSTSTSK